MLGSEEREIMINKTIKHILVVTTIAMTFADEKVYCTSEASHILKPIEKFDTCCDFSFKVQKDQKIDGCVLGKTDSGQEIVIPLKRMKKWPYCLSEILMRFAVDAVQDLDDTRKNQLIHYFTTLSKNPIGCELMRVLIAKCMASGKSKMIFLPAKIKTAEAGFCYKSFMTEADIVLKRVTRYHVGKTYNFMFFPVDKVAVSGEFPFISLGKDVSQDAIPTDAALFHELIHSLQPETSSEKLSKSTGVIEAMHPSVTPFVITNVKQYWKSVLSSDVEYESMFGVGRTGLNLLNEAAYMATKYGKMRVSHCDIPAVVDQNGKQIMEISLDTALDFFRNFIRNYGDFNLYRAYLDLESPIRKQLPCFGIGAYQCSDLDPIKLKEDLQRILKNIKLNYSPKMKSGDRQLSGKSARKARESS